MKTASNGTGVRITAFGAGRFQFHPLVEGATVADALRAHSVQAEGRRVAINGHPTRLDAGVREGDELTVVPRVQGG